jgi:hypothetical protein
MRSGLSTCPTATGHRFPSNSTLRASCGIRATLFSFSSFRNAFFFALYFAFSSCGSRFQRGSHSACNSPLLLFPQPGTAARRSCMKRK